MGGDEEVAEGICTATQELVDDLEVNLRMEVSRNSNGFRKGNTAPLGSRSRLGVLMKRKMQKLGVGICRRARNLGMDYGTGKGGRIKTVLNSRNKEAKRKIVRAMRLWRRAAPSVARVSLMPSICYARVTDGRLKGWRTMIARCFGNIGGRSITARLALEGSDPGLQLVVEAIMCWANAWWDEVMPRGEMRSAWRHAIRIVGMAARPNAEVQGGA